MDDYLTIQEVAQLYAVTERTVRNWIYEGKLEAHRIGGRVIRIEPRSLDTLSEPVQFQGYRSRRSGPSSGTFLFHSFSWN